MRKVTNQPGFLLAQLPPAQPPPLLLLPIGEAPVDDTLAWTAWIMFLGGQWQASTVLWEQGGRWAATHSHWAWLGMHHAVSLSLRWVFSAWEDAVAMIIMLHSRGNKNLGLLTVR